MQYTADFIKALTSPDRRFGEVPFYWWNGGELTKERLTSQLEALAEKGLAGVQVNYCHLNGGGENNLPHGGHGRSIEGTPPQFSDEWWDIFNYYTIKSSMKLYIIYSLYRRYYTYLVFNTLSSEYNTYSYLSVILTGTAAREILDALNN